MTQEQWAAVGAPDVSIERRIAEILEAHYDDDSYSPDGEFTLPGWCKHAAALLVANLGLEEDRRTTLRREPGFPKGFMRRYVTDWEQV